MAANKFATMVHKKTNKFTLVLVYVALEWALIAMLLLNALFSYLILRFSEFFGLETPCIFCSRIDHVFDARKKKGFQLDLLCKAHASEISNSGFCCSDQKLGEFEEFFDSCSEILVERKEIEIVTNTSDLETAQKENFFEFDRVEERAESIEIESGDRVLEIETGKKEQDAMERDELDSDTVNEDTIQIDNQIERKIEEFKFETAIEDPILLDSEIERKMEELEDQNCDKFAVFESLEMKEDKHNSLTGEVYESDEDVSIGTEIPDIESTNEFLGQETHIKEDNQGIRLVHEEDFVELKTISIDSQNIETNLSLELSDIMEEKTPDTPTSIESLDHLYKSLLLVKEKESGAEESFNGSVASDLEGINENLIAEIKALNDLYAELEEERNASAIAANQAMAMINRLQEEKAAMQMEALHYQRMMEEQSQYDLEALEFLNEQLEAYQNKVLEYEGKRNLKLMENESYSPPFTSSNCEDSDGSSIDLNGEDRKENSLDEEKDGQITPIEEVLCFDESSDKFEEERLLILQQLKLLEEKLFTLADDDEEQQQHEEDFEVINPINHISEENGNYKDKQNAISNGFATEMNENHELVRRITRKNLLPLFHAAENGQEVENEHLNGFDCHWSQNEIPEGIEFGNGNCHSEDNFGDLYNRLLALESDKEFLKRCIRKGDKGVDLLQEISRNLCILRQ